MPPRTRCWVLLLFLLLAALPGLPARMEASDQVGVYFDIDAEEFCISAEPFATIVAYLLLVEPSAADEIAGWECAVEIDNANLTNMILAGHGLDIDGSPGGFVVGLGTPVPSATLVELAQLEVLVWGGDPVRIHIQPNPATGEETPLYAVVSGGGTLLPLTPHAIGDDNLVAAINLPSCEPESATWGQVKKFYD